jgi:hypothetical protein
MRLPETGGVGVVPESSLDHHRARGWLRVSEALGRDERDQLRLADYAQAPDLDTEPDPGPGPGTSEQPATSAPAEQNKEA